ncbi:MAG TPA: MFS transporter [Flexivirga sp.]|uniref:MFS transporter n=1 Tax=Flexivirga sp. TaxID=1962927 RepID=UPI002B98D69A|nr:MFS transporter [Flexivirga sp.]HWC21161.1 MFS transporter [Flexivirga sp.]
MSSLRGMFADTRPLQVPAYRRLWSANIITVIGAQLTVVAVPAQIYAETHSSAYVGLTGVFGLVPLVIFGLYGGALADVMDRRRLLMISTVGLIGCSALFWVQAMMHVDNVWVILSLFAIQQAFFAVNQPTRSAILPRLIPLNQLPAANSLNMTVMQFGAIAGPLVGGALIPVLGFQYLYLTDTICLFATLWAVITLPAMPPTHDGTSKAGLRSVIDGFIYLRGHKVLLMSFLVDIIAMVFGMPRALFPQVAHESFGGPTDGGLAFALLFAAIPAGAVVGGIFSGWVSRVERQGLAVVWAIVGWGAAMVVFGVGVGLADGRADLFLGLALVGLIVGGAADMASAAFRSTMLQESAADDVRGRLQGVFTVVVAGGPRVADVVHGGAAAVVGTSVAATGGGVLVIVLVVVAALAIPVFVRYRVVRSPEPAETSPTP